MSSDQQSRILNIISINLVDTMWWGLERWRNRSLDIKLSCICCLLCAFKRDHVPTSISMRFFPEIQYVLVTYARPP